MVRLSKQPGSSDPKERSKKNNVDSLRQHSSFLFDRSTTTIDGEEYDISKFDTTPPTEEIVFDVSCWENDEELQNPIKSKENDESMPPTSTSTSTFRNDGDTIRGIPSMLFLAACTYSRVFGLDYLLEESHDGPSDDGESTASSTTMMFMDWLQGPPLRSMRIRYGDDTHTSETKSADSTDDHQDEEEHHPDDSTTSSSTDRHERILWSVILLGSVSVLGFASAVFYLAIAATIQGLYFL